MNRPFCSTGCPQWMVCACAFRGAECPFAKVDRAIKNYNNNQRGIEGMPPAKGNAEPGKRNAQAGQPSQSP
jgi:hypothetical protein